MSGPPVPIRVFTECLSLHLADERGVQWLSSRVLDLRPRGCEFKSHWSQWVVCYSKTLYLLLSTGSIQEDPHRHD